MLATSRLGGWFMADRLTFVRPGIAQQRDHVLHDRH
jgi:hypothetical protein